VSARTEDARPEREPFASEASPIVKFALGLPAQNIVAPAVVTHPGAVAPRARTPGAADTLPASTGCSHRPERSSRGLQSQGGTDISRTIIIPADVVPLVYSGLQLDIWQRVMPELDELFVRRGRLEDPEWFTEPFERLDRTRALLEEIDWPRAHVPAEVAIDFDAH
jgi:hypothetical protein